MNEAIDALLYNIFWFQTDRYIPDQIVQSFTN